MRQVYHRGNQTLGLTSYTFLLDVINIARHCHLSLGDILIKAAAVTLSIWIHVDKTEDFSSRLMTQCRRHSDLNLNSPAIKGLVRHSTLHLSSSVKEALLFFNPQINSSVQHWGIKQAGICLRCESEEVLRLRNTVIRPPLELSEALQAPGEGKVQGNLIRHNTFSAQLPHPSVVLKESQQSSLRGKSSNLKKQRHPARLDVLLCHWNRRL